MSDKRRTTILDLKPDTSTECAPGDYVLFAANLMAKNRTHCVLVKDTDKNLLGLFTAKDLALRVVANGLNPKTTRVDEIMTDNPVLLHSNTPITKALKTMVDRGIRHLPLADDQGKIKSVLDITRCFQQAMLRLERITKNANQLNAILNDVADEYEDVHTREAHRIMKDIEKLGQLIEIPTISSIVSKAKLPVFIDSSSTVKEAAEMMQENETTALLVRDRTSPSRKIIGIFTSKDICFRVLAKNYDPSTSTVARFLTTSPEFAKDSMNISSALRLMFQGSFMNLPVAGSQTHDIIGIVNVLDLTYAALAQLSKSDELIEAESFGAISMEVKSRLGDDSITWDKFWNTLEKSTDDIHNLETSAAKSPTTSRSQTPKIGSRRASWNQLSMSGSRRSSFTTRRLSSHHDSISEVGSQSVISALQKVHSEESQNRTSFYIRAKSVNFKIKYNYNKIHKISMTVKEGASIYDDIKFLELLKQEIESKLGVGLENSDLLYLDEDGDLVTISDELDLIEAINLSKSQDLSSVEILIKSKTTGALASIYEFLNDYKIRIMDYFNGFNQSAPVVSGTFFVLSLGIILGFTYSKRNLFRA
jgi:CBS domain-containing protein